MFRFRRKRTFSFKQQTYKRLKKNKGAVFGLCVIFMALFVSLFGYIIAPIVMQVSIKFNIAVLSQPTELPFEITEAALSDLHKKVNQSIATQSLSSVASNLEGLSRNYRANDKTNVVEFFVGKKEKLYLYFGKFEANDFIFKR